MSTHIVTHLCAQIHNQRAKRFSVGDIEAGGSASLSIQAEPRVHGCTAEIAGLKHTHIHTRTHKRIHRDPTAWLTSVESLTELE